MSGLKRDKKATPNTYWYNSDLLYNSAKSTSSWDSAAGEVISNIHVAGLYPSLILGTDGIACKGFKLEP